MIKAQTFNFATHETHTLTLLRDKTYYNTKTTNEGIIMHNL